MIAPRLDGFCVECVGRKAVTRDGRFCRVCLKAMVRRLSPGDVGPCRDRKPALPDGFTKLIRITPRGTDWGGGVWS